MNNILKIFCISIFLFTSLSANIDCPPDSSSHLDLRTMLPDGSPNPTQGQIINTGLCACVNFANNIEINGSEITFTINIVDNEPIRGIELNIYNDFNELTYHDVAIGEKFQNLVNDQGNPTSDMTILGNAIDDYVKILAYSVNRARTIGDGEEGNLLFLTYTLNEGASLPDNIKFYFTVANIPGTTAGIPPGSELLNVVCNFPNQDNPVSVSTVTALAVEVNLLPKAFALFQNYPNPFNPSTQISFDIPSSEFVTLRIFNLLGQDVKTLASKIINPGRYTFDWDGRDIMNNDVASGVYFYELRSESFISRKKMLLIR